MAISIDWGTRIISIPKADLTLIQASPEVREINVNWFRLELKKLEDDDAGIPFPDTHRHSTEVTLAGLTYARIVEIINGYTVEFENGQYSVNCVGANHNLSDVKVQNSVSLIVNNAAGLITNTAIEFSSFNGGVLIDVVNGSPGTVFPAGTEQSPVDNLADAMLIAQYRGFSQIFIVGNLTIDSGADYSGMTFIGSSKTKSTLTVSSLADVTDCEFQDCTVTGTLDGDCKAIDCVVKDINYISGYIEQCVLEGTIVLGGGAKATFLDCWAGSVLGSPPEIDLGGSGQLLVMQNFNGFIKWKNKTGTEQANASLNAGWVILDSTITNGDINIIGVGHVEANQGPGATLNTDHLVDAEKIKDLHLIQGLDASSPMTVTPTSRQAGGVTQTISGDGVNTSTVTRNP